LLSEAYKNILPEFTGILPDAIFTSSPKIYKGENYLSLPYVLMDYPRVFFKEDVFAIRSFFWWGNYFSITLHLSGKYFQYFKNNIADNLYKDDTLFICINEEQWAHHFEETNYKPIKAIDSAENILNKPFIKIAKKLSLSEWNAAELFYRNNYKNLLQMIMADS